MARMLTIPSACRKVFAMFAEAVIEKASQAKDAASNEATQERLLQDFVQAFEILLRHSNDDMLRLLAESQIDDLVYTLICYLDNSVRDSVASYLANNPDHRARIIDSFRVIQDALKGTINELIQKGEMPVARALGKTA